jgi:excisionase family DNA binding protein
LTPKFYTVKEAADVLRVHPETVKRILRRTGAPHRRAGAKIILSEADLVGLLEEHRLTGDTNPFCRKNNKG